MDPAKQNTAPVVKATYEVVRNPQPQAIVVHCSDPGLQPAFEQFIEHGLRLSGHLLSHLGMTIELYYGKFADADRTRMSFEKVAP